MDAKHRPMRAVKADAAAKAMKVWTARVNGETWESAAALAGFSDAPGAVRAVRNYFGALPPTPSAEDARVLWRERLELLWRQAVTDARQQRPGALRAGVAIAQRAAALDGLDAPVKIQTTDPTGAEFGAMLAMFAKSHGLALPIEAGLDDMLDVEVIDDSDDLGELGAGEWVAEEGTSAG